MIENVQYLIHAVGIDAVVVVSILPALLAVVTTLYASVFAVRAKRRAMYAIRRARSQDLEFSRLLRPVDQHRHLGAADIDAVREAIRGHIQDLSQRDRKYVDAGLDQSSSKGFERFVGEIAGHRHAV